MLEYQFNKLVNSKAEFIMFPTYKIILVYKLLQTSSSEELICEQLGRLSLSVVISPALDIVLALLYSL